MHRLWAEFFNHPFVPLGFRVKKKRNTKPYRKGMAVISLSHPISKAKHFYICCEEEDADCKHSYLVFPAVLLLACLPAEIF